MARPSQPDDRASPGVAADASALASRSFFAKFRELTVSEVIALGEALVLIALSAPAIRLVKFRTLGRLASLRLRRAIPEADRAAVVQRVTWAVDRAAKRAPGRAMCFERGLSAQIMLRRRGVDSTMFYGVGHETTGALAAHVWVLDRGVDVAGGEQAPQYAALASFPDGRLTSGAAS